jgi:hypothetical protein
MFGTPDSAVALAATIHQAAGRAAPEASVLRIDFGPRVPGASLQAGVEQAMQLANAAPALRDALTILAATCKRMDCEVEAHRPSEAEYQAALAIADAALDEARSAS